jgi:prophage regulatory protein
MAERIMRRSEVERLVGLKRSSIYAAVAAGTFPRPVPLGTKAVGWVESEIAAWQAARIAERDSKVAA